MIRTQAKLFAVGLRQVLHDGMLLLLLPAPFFAGLLLRLLLPFLAKLLDDWFGFALPPWYPLTDAFLMAIAPSMVAMVCAFLMLDERDEGVGSYFSVTPAGGRAYLLARLGWPLLWAFGCTLLVQALFGLSGASAEVAVSVALISALQGVVMAMLLVSLASNKVEGLALAKLTGAFLLGLPVPWLLSAPLKYLFALIPSVWMGELLRGSFRPDLLAGGVLTSLIWILALMRIFLRRARL